MTQGERLELECPAKVYLRRLLVIQSSPLSDVNPVRASNQFAMPVLTYLMWTQHWPIMELWVIDREARKIICENGGKHPVSLTEVMYLAREKRGCELHSIEHDYELTRLLQAPRQDRAQSQSRCFAWLQNWTCTPTHTIARVMKLYEQLTPTKVYTVPKTGTTQGDISSRMCGNSPQTLANLPSGCPALAQSN